MKRVSRVCSKFAFVALLTVAFSVGIQAQRVNLEKISAMLEQSECVAVGAGKIKICRYDYKFENKTVESIVVRPAAEGVKYPSLMLLPGFDLTARDLIPMGVMYAHEGFASVAITPPGFGKSEGTADFVGAATRRVYAAGWNRFKREAFVDASKMGIYGHSRGGMAASLLAVELPDAKAAVAASGIYDFRKAFTDIGFKGIRDRMLAETGMTDAAVRERSAVLKLESLKVPLLLLHGAKDDKTPVSQAYLLRDELTALKKDFEIKIFAEAGHALDEKEVVPVTTEFFRRKMNIETRARK